MHVDGAAKLLGVGRTTIYTLARKGDLPGRKVGKEWRFHKNSVLQWLANASEASSLASLMKQGKVKVLGKK